MCMAVSSSQGRVLRPKECDRLILYLKDLNLANPDKYGTCMLVAFLQQVLTYRGFYDHNLEWVGLEGVQVVGSITAGTGMGRHQLNTRFTSVLRVHSLPQPDREHLEVVYSSYLGAVLRAVAPSHPVWSHESKASQLASTMVGVFQQVKKSFSVDDHSHYLFTPRQLTEWTLGLSRYVVDSADRSAGPLLEAWAYEASRLFRDKLATEDDRARFDETLRGALRAEWNSNAAENVANAFFVTAGDASAAPGAPLPKSESILNHRNRTQAGITC